MPNNPLFQALGGGMMPNMQGLNNMSQLISQFQQFKNSFTGNAQQQVQQLLNSGRLSQEGFNQLAQMANQLRGMLK